MKNKMSEIMLAALMMSGGLAGNAHAVKRYAPPPLPSNLPSYKHSGELPTGCKLESTTLTFRKNDSVLSLEIDIVFGSEKAKNKRITKYQREIEEYILHLSIEEIIKRNEFTIHNDGFGSKMIKSTDK